MVKILKYLSINDLMDSPNLQIRLATRKNRAERLTVDAMTKLIRSILNAPAVIVNILYGIGVNPAVNMIKKPCSLYWFCTDVNKSFEKPGTLLKKK